MPIAKSEANNGHFFNKWQAKGSFSGELSDFTVRKNGRLSVPGDSQPGSAAAAEVMFGRRRGTTFF